MISDIVFDLYFKKQQIKHIEKSIDNYGDNEWPSDLFDKIIELNDDFYAILDGSNSVEETCKQLNLLEKHEGNA